MSAIITNYPGLSLSPLSLRVLVPLTGAGIHRLGFTITSAYHLTFNTHLISVLPPTFAGGFKAICASTISNFGSPDSASANTKMHVDPTVFLALETLGLVDRYESLVASVGYEYIEAHVLSTCAGKWSEPMLSKLRDWMSNKIVPWMLWPYGRGASTSQGFDFRKPSTLLSRVFPSGRSSQQFARGWFAV